MKKIMLLLLLPMLAFSFGDTKKSINAGSIFHKLYGKKYSEAISICELNDGSFIISGENDSKGMVMKIDAEGNILKSNIIKNTNRSNTVASSQDGGFIAGGTNLTEGSVIKFDKNLNIEKRVELKGDYGVHKVHQLKNGSYFVSMSSEKESEKAYYILDKNLKITAKKVTSDPYLDDVYDTKDGNIIVLVDGNLAKINANTLDAMGVAEYTNKVSAFMEIKDGYIAIMYNQLSQTNNDLYLAKIDFEGKLIWSKLILKSEPYPTCKLVVADNNQFIIFVPSGAVYKTDENAKIIWKKDIFFKNEINNYISSALKTKSNEYIFVGSSDDFRMYSFKLDTNGNKF